MERPSTMTEQAIKARVYRDLSPSLGVVHGKMAGSFTVGALASLSVCAQFGLGLSPWSLALQARLMELGPVGCMVACGFLFALFPLIVLRIISSPLQFRHFLKKRGTALLAWLVVTESTILTMSDFGADLTEIVIWTLSGAMTVAVLAYLFDRYLRVTIRRQSLV